MAHLYNPQSPASIPELMQIKQLANDEISMKFFDLQNNFLARGFRFRRKFARNWKIGEPIT